MKFWTFRGNIFTNIVKVSDCLGMVLYALKAHKTEIWMMQCYTVDVVATDTLLRKPRPEYSGPHHQRHLANCGWMPASYTSGQPSNPRRHPTCWASSQWSHTVSSTPFHGAWTSAALSAHPSIECKHTAPQIETLICTRRTTSHQFIWQQQHVRGAVGRSPMKCGVDGQPHKTPHFHPWHRHPPPGITLPERAWVRLDRIRTGVGRFRSCLYKWGMASSAACECGAEKQTVDHVVLQCPIHRPPHGLHGLTVLDDKTI